MYAEREREREGMHLGTVKNNMGSSRCIGACVWQSAGVQLIETVQETDRVRL